jgi:hypothetical protein
MPSVYAASASRFAVVGRAELVTGIGVGASEAASDAAAFGYGWCAGGARP